MSDPAVDAAARAFAQVEDDDLAYASERDKSGFITAAREALAPLRAKHQKVQRPDGTYRCTSCRDAYGGHADWPTGTDRLIYPSEEL